MSENPVITQDQAKKITGGRHPLTIEAYTTAIAKLEECLSIDDAVYFSSFADAAAAWAKINHDERAVRLARALKLQAGERCYKLAKLARPQKRIGGRVAKGSHVGMLGPRSLMMEHGFTKTEATGASRLASMAQDTKQRLLNRPLPPTLSAVAGTRRDRLGGLPDPWESSRVNFNNWSSNCRRINPKEAALAVPSGQIEMARKRATEISEWIDAFQQVLSTCNK